MEYGKAVINSNEIQVFPTVNSRDNGKLLLEENLSDTVRKITKLNFVYESGYQTLKDTGIWVFSNNGFQCSPAEQINGGTQIKCNINGYTIILYHPVSFNLFLSTDEERIKENNPQHIFITPESLEKFNNRDNWVNKENYGNTNANVEIPIGLVISKMANNNNRLKGDKLFNNNYYYYGVELRAGENFNNAPNEDKLLLGWLYGHYEESLELKFGLFNPNSLYKIDGDTVVINNEDGMSSLPEYLKGFYVSKKGNEYEDSEVVHDSDIYGSLMFRDGKTAEDYNIEIGFNNYEFNNFKKIEFNGNEYYGGIKLISKIPALPVSTFASSSLILGGCDLLNEQFYDSYGNFYTDTILSPFYDIKRVSEEYGVFNKFSNLKINDTDISIVPDYSANYYSELGLLNTMSYNFTNEYFSAHYDYLNIENNRESSCIELRCDKNLSRLSFGMYETTPMFIDYDTENNDLSINDKLGSIGVVKFCDGQCVDQNETYSKGNHENDLPYNYKDDFIPKEYSEVNDLDTTGWNPLYNYSSYCQIYRFPFADGEESVFQELSISEDAYNYLNSNTNNTLQFFTARAGYSGYIGPELMEILYGFYINKSKGFVPSHGAFDYNEDNTFSEKDGYSYIQYKNTDNIEVKSYDFISLRYKIPKSLQGNKLFLSSLLDIYEYCKIKNITDYDSFVGLAGILDTENNETSTDRINAYFCTDYNGTNLINFGYNTSYPQPNSKVNNYTEIEFHTFMNSLSKGIIEIPEVDTENLYFIISIPFHSYISTIYLYSYNDSLRYNVEQPGTNNDNLRGFGVSLGMFSLMTDAEKYIITSNNVSEINSNYTDESYYLLKDIEIKQKGLGSWLNPCGFKIKGKYTTSKSYKSFRIHGFFRAYVEEGESYTSEQLSNYTYYRLIYNLGFDNSLIQISKLENVVIDGKEYPTVYRLSREDGYKINFTARIPDKVYTGNLNAIYPFSYKYFYIDNLTKPTKFFLNDTKYESNSEINIYDMLSNRGQRYSDLYSYTDLSGSPYEITGGGAWWWLRDLTITNTAGINFNIGLNKFNSNVDTYLNETTFINKAVFGDIDDEFNTTIDSSQARFVYDKTKIITLNEDGITLERDLTNINDTKDVTISKAMEEDFKGINIDGDFRADRVFNAVYNDYADNVKCSRVTDYEPGDIICKDPFSDEYIISNYDIGHLVVGVYSDTYGHLLGGDKDKSIEENSKNYVPIAVAGNVRVKVKGFVNAGDLIEASNIPGVGQSSKNPQLGTIVGKALETKNTSGVERILMQVMLM